MPFIPHTESEVRDMLSSIGVDSINELFDEIPTELRVQALNHVPEGIPEMDISRLMHARAAEDGMPLSFIGAGAYEHHIPAAVWQITTRGEFYSAYTPYQAEASQGTLQVLYEYQSMMANLTAMDVSNTSLYEGASALAEACLMAVRANRKSKSKRILMPAAVHPLYRQVAASICSAQDIEFETLPYCGAGGHTQAEGLESHADDDIAALVVPQPNFFGTLEDVDELTDWAHAHGALVIAVVNPMALAVITPPGEWGEAGADIACGEGQPLGVPLASGGPYFGFLCCTQKLVRQMPGRLVGRTVDQDGKEGFVLTLQAREQHIRRSKATSNICTNQGLSVTAATIYLALTGAEGLERVAMVSHANAARLCSKLTALDGVETMFDRPYFHEFVLRLSEPTEAVLERLSARGIIGGLSLKQYYPELGDAVLVCATETKSEQDIQDYADLLHDATQHDQVA